MQTLPFLWLALTVIGVIFLVCYLRTSNRDFLTAGSGCLFLFAVSWLAFGDSIKPTQPITAQEKWAIFKKEYDCKLIEKREGHSTGGVGIATNGQAGIMFGKDVPSQAAYLCNDGVTYWKNE